MNQAIRAVCILVVEVRASGASKGAGETARALERVGSDVELCLRHDALSCRALSQSRDLDLVVLDRALGAEATAVLEALRHESVPIVVITRSPGEEEAIDAFRRGAADCVRAGPDFVETLTAVAIEQIRRCREAREHAEAESRVRRLEAIREAIFNQHPAALAVLEGKGAIVTVNPEFCRAFDVSPEQARGRSLEELLPADLMDSGGLRDLTLATASLAGSSPRVAQTNAGGSGTRVFDLRAQPLDEQGRVLLVLSDVSEREALQQRMDDLRRYNEYIIQNMNSALLVVDPQGRIRFTNADAELILGGEAEALAGRDIREWFPEQTSGGSLIARTLEEGTRFKGAETTIRRADGRVVPVGISCAPFGDVDGRRLGAVAIFQDLTEIKQLQRQLVQTEKMASIGQLAAGVAHEINNPMGFIHANLFQMAEYLGDLRRAWTSVEALRAAPAASQASAVEVLSKVSEELDIDFVLSDFAKAIRESQEGSERIRHIVQDLREFSHRDTAERVPADINQCLDSTVGIVWTMMKHSVVLVKEYGDIPRVACFPMQLKQVFMNLLVNAYQAIEEKVGTSGATGEIGVNTAIHGDEVVVTIRDSGAGIRPDHLDRIFDPFFTTKKVGAGTGLGLSTCYSIVERHGGRIAVESTLGRGTTFEVRLPLLEAPELPDAP